MLFQLFFNQIILFKNWFLGINIVKVENFGFSFKNSGMFQRAKRRRSTLDGRVVDYSIGSSAVGKLDTTRECLCEKGSFIDQPKMAITLNSGFKMPILGLGVWRMDGKDIRNLLINAIKIGYRHFDCAGNPTFPSQSLSLNHCLCFLYMYLCEWFICYA